MPGTSLRHGNVPSQAWAECTTMRTSLGRRSFWHRCGTVSRVRRRHPLARALTPDYRFRRTRRGDRVGMPVNHLPAAVLAPEDRRDPNCHRSHLLCSADPRPESLDLDGVSHIGGVMTVVDDPTGHRR